MRALALLLVFGLFLPACAGDDTSGLREEIASLQTQVAAGPPPPATSNATASIEPTVLPTKAPRPAPAATPTPPEASPPGPTSKPPLAPTSTTVSTATPVPTQLVCDADTQRYAADINYLNALQEKLIRKGVLDSGWGTDYFSSLPCITPCDRQWLTNAVVAGERLLQTGVRPDDSRGIPTNLCRRVIIGN